jgi:2-polyprenyl-3-methyl-5-hydroxy-6-metoxy-1,4-benzoquinol methylase
MTNPNFDQTLSQRYADMPYPPYDPQVEAERLTITRLDMLDKVSTDCFDGGLDITQGINVLVAGGGTGDATLFLAEQLRDTPSEVTYVDLSLTSMKLAQEGAAVRGLSNIRWIHGSLIELAEDPALSDSFDYINCCGVLHHLEDPLEGLQALESVLAPDGAMVLMVYALYGRQEVYRLQTLFRTLNAGITNPEEQIKNARAVLNNMPLRWWEDPRNRLIVDEIQTNSGLYDMLLHTSDQAFTVRALHESLDSAGLKKITFADPIMGSEFGYKPEAYLPETLWSELGKLSAHEREALAEETSGEMARHALYVAKNLRQPASLEDPNMVPTYSMQFGVDEQAAIQELAEQHQAKPVAVTPLAQHGKHIEVTFGEYGHELLRQIDGVRTVNEIVDRTGERTGVDSAAIFASLKNLYEPLHAADWLMLRQAGMPPFQTAHDMQSAWLKRNRLDRPVQIESYTLNALHKVVAGHRNLPTTHF